MTPKRSAAPPGRDAESRHHLVEDQQRAVLVGEPPQRRQESRIGRDEPRVADHRLDDDRRDAAGVPPQNFLDAVHIIERRRQRQRGERRRHARRIGKPERRDAGARAHEKAVAVPVIAAVELEEQVASRRGARDTERAHRRLGAARHEPQHLHVRHPLRARSRRAPPRARSGCRSSSRAPSSRAARRAPPPAHGRGRAAPTTARSRGTRCRPRPRCARPRPRSTTNGSPPTPPNARTGELTPPGNSSRARAISSCERAVSRAGSTLVIVRSSRWRCS